MSICFIILAAGQSKRLNSNIPKPYIDYKGKPIVQHSIDKAKKCKKISKIILIINKKHKHMKISEKIFDAANQLFKNSIPVFSR